MRLAVRWLSFVLCLGLGVADDAQGRKGVCDFDDLGSSPRASFIFTVETTILCMKAGVSNDTSKLNPTSSPASSRQFFTELCPNVQTATACMAADRNRYNETCAAVDNILAFEIMSKMAEQLLVSGCQNAGGEKLIQLMSSVDHMLYHMEPMDPLKRCLVRETAFMAVIIKDSIDFGSRYYLLYRAIDKLNKCLPLVQDDDHRAVLQWTLDEVSAKMKCKLPEQNSLVLCSEIDVTHLPISDVCKLKPISQDHLYDWLEERAANSCYAWAINFDTDPDSDHTNIEWLKDRYSRVCRGHSELPTCLLETSAYGESCLSREDNKHFQLEVQAVEDYISRLCVEGGVFLAKLMHEVFKNAPEHGNAFRDCHKTVDEASKTDQRNVNVARDMRFYHDVIAFKRCVVEKLHATNDLSGDLEIALDDVMKKMKCVNPKDGAVVHCETIHVH